MSPEVDVKSLFAEVRRLSDIEAIRRLCADWCYFCDVGDVGGMAKLFMEDGIFDQFPMGRPLPNVVTGRADLLASFRKYQSRANKERDEIVSHIGHLSTTERIDVDGDMATATSHIHFRSLNLGGYRRDAFVRYEDRWVRTSLGWKIARRVCVPLVPDNDILISLADAANRDLRAERNGNQSDG